MTTAARYSGDGGKVIVGPLIYPEKGIEDQTRNYGVPFVSKLTIQLMKVLHVDVQFYGDDSVKQH